MKKIYQLAGLIGLFALSLNLVWTQKKWAAPDKELRYWLDARHNNTETLTFLREPKKEIKGKFITLKLFDRSHWNDYKKAFSYDIADQFFATSCGENRDIEAYLRHAWLNQRYRRWLIYSGFDTKTGAFSGVIELRGSPKGPLLSGWAKKSHQGIGASKETIELSTREFFEVTNIAKITAEVAPDNVRCQYFLIKNDFSFSHIDSENKNNSVFMLKSPALKRQFRQI